MEVEAATRRWFDRFVVELGLCPFAKQVSPYIAVSEASSEQALLNDLAQQIEELNRDDHRETTLLVHPNVLQDFLDYNDFLGVVDDLLTSSDLSGVLQIASFHPNYQFADTRADDAENYANRSPYPMLHLLREDSVSQAVDSHPDVAQIPIRNAEVLEKLGPEVLRERLKNCFTDD